MRGVLGTWLAASLLWSTVSWGAAPTSSAADSPPPTVRYGWQVVGIDAATLALGGVALAIVSQQPRDKSPAVALGLVALGTYLTGPPILHAARGNSENAGESFGLRLGLPLGAGLTGLAVGGAICGKFEHPEAELDLTCVAMPLGLALLGGALGVLGAMTLDATLVAREPEIRTPAWSLVPSFDPRWRLVGLSAVGRF